MDPETRALLEENNRLIQETHEMVRVIRRNARIGFAFKILTWAIILGVPVFLWRLYFPNVDITTPGDISNSIERLEDLLRTYEGVPR